MTCSFNSSAIAKTFVSEKKKRGAVSAPKLWTCERSNKKHLTRHHLRFLPVLTMCKKNELWAFPVLDATLKKRRLRLKWGFLAWLIFTARFISRVVALTLELILEYRSQPFASCPFQTKYTAWMIQDGADCMIASNRNRGQFLFALETLVNIKYK